MPGELDPDIVRAGAAHIQKQSEVPNRTQTPMSKATGSSRRVMRARGMSAWAVAVALMLSACAMTTEVEDVAATKTAKIDEPISDFLRNAAESSQSSNNYAAATDYYQKLRLRNPGDVEATIGMARNLRLSGQANEAARMLAASLEENPLRLDVKAELGKAQLAAGLSHEAIATLTAVVVQVPGDWRALSALGIAHDVTGDPGKAQELYNAALVVSPNAVSVLNNLALSLTLSGNLTGGIDTLERATRLQGSGVQVRQNLALLYAMKGDLNAAERLLKRDLSTEIVQHNLRYYQLINPTIAALSSSSSTVTNSGATNAQLPVLAVTSQPPSEPTVTMAPLVIEKQEIDVAVLPPAVTVVEDGFTIELGAFATKDAAISGSSLLRNTHNDLLGGLRFEVVQIEDGGVAGDYRVRVGPVESEFVAADLCTKIHSNNQPCLLIAP
ncbi:MAG: tetratricopeptide repeat protein [Alphaproteobacteria bacterium]|nr:tetratricopeptide repeat protein [Alphaproteobacteria bacterium]